MSGGAITIDRPWLNSVSRNIVTTIGYDSIKFEAYRLAFFPTGSNSMNWTVIDRPDLKSELEIFCFAIRKHQ
jgi:hypothetical protein